jgi:hypothetical protein
MAKEKVQTEETKENELQATETSQAPKESTLAAIVKSIAALPQADRLVLYGRLDVIMNEDRQKASHGVDSVGYLFDEAVKSL